MTGSLLLSLAAALLGGAALLEMRGRLAAERKDGPALPHPAQELRGWPLELAARLGLRERLARAGLAERISVPALAASKAACGVLGLFIALPAAPAAPGRLSILVGLALPVAGFLAPDAWLERRARQRLARLRGALPDALDLLSVGTSAGRSPVTGMAEISTGDGPLARELGVLAAEESCGVPQREALEGFRHRVPTAEVAGMCGVIERSRRYGSPLAEQLSEQASSLRAMQRRRVEEQAARAAPKIQLAVALLLVPSVLLMIAAGLLANVDRFLAGL